MKTKAALLPLAVAAALFAVSGCSTMQIGSRSAKTAASGSAGGANSHDANQALAHCDAPLGTIAVTEDTGSPWYSILANQYKLGPTTPVLKLIIQQSNCFVVVDRGRAMNNMMGERALAQSGELRGSSNFGKGQLVSADYSLTPSITFSNNDAGGAGALVGGLLGPVGAIVGGSMHSKEASTLLTLDDNRSGVQLAIAEGSAENWDFGGLGGMFGGAAGGIGGGYANTAEGKVIVAAFVDSYNTVVKAVRNYKAQHVAGGLGTGGNMAVQGSTTAAAPTGNGMSLYQAQQKLNRLGFDVGEPDGKLGPHTRAELKKFQRSRQIPATGELDGATVEQLSR